MDMQLKDKFIAVFATCALAFGVATPALAIPPATGDDAPVTTYQTDNVYVTKHLITVKGVTNDQPFTFKVVENKGIEDARQDNYPAKAPTVADIKIALDGNQSDVDANNNLVHRFAQGKIDLSGFTEKFAKDHPGLYAYTITENPIESKLGGIPSSPDDRFTCDTGSYTLRVYCKNDGSRLVTVENNTTHKKVDPSKKTEQELTGDAVPGFASFENKFMVSNNPNNPDEGKKQNLVISKTVNAGEYGFKNQEFTVKIKFHKPGQAIDTDYTTFKLNGATNTLTKTFENLPVGTTYEIIEVATDEWKGQGTATTTASVTTKTASVEKTDKNVTLNSLIGTDAGNKVDFTNTFDEDVSITGLAIDNAPFILMIGVPVVVAAAWVIKRRMARN